MHDSNHDTTDESSNAAEYERVDDVEIAAGDTFLDFTDADQQLVIVEGTGDVTEIAPDAPIPDEYADRVDRDPEAVIAATDAPGDHMALDARTFRRAIFEGVLRPIKRPKTMWALLHETHRDELAAEIGGER